jgi:hypothetical protein
MSERPPSTNKETARRRSDRLALRRLDWILEGSGPGHAKSCARLCGPTAHTSPRAKPRPAAIPQSRNRFVSADSLAMPLRTQRTPLQTSPRCRADRRPDCCRDRSRKPTAIDPMTAGRPIARRSPRRGPLKRGNGRQAIVLGSKPPRLEWAIR